MQNNLSIKKSWQRSSHYLMKILFLILFLGVTLMTSFSSCSSSKNPSQAPNAQINENQENLRVMSYNIHHANPPSRPDVIDIDAIVATIKTHDPDFVSLQEVDANTERSGKGNQAGIIAERLGMYFYFAKALNYDGGRYGNAILSKYPLKNATSQILPNAPDDITEERVLAFAEVKLPEGPEMIFASTHLDYKKDSSSRIVQLEKILEISQKVGKPMILAGDFNDIEGSATIKLLDSEFTRTCRDCAPTIPVNEPNRAIDFIAFTHPENKFKVKSHKVINETYASDHLPIIAVIELME